MQAEMGIEAAEHLAKAKLQKATVLLLQDPFSQKNKMRR